MSKAFVSYAWENEEHKKWVKSLAEDLRKDGVEVILDQWHLAPGSQLTEFMECSIRENDFVLIICTPEYKKKSDERVGGVGYEGDIITSEMFTDRNQKKFIPILREGEWRNSAPSWLLGKLYVDLSEKPYSEDNYNDLLATIHNMRAEIPPVGRVPVERFQKRTHYNPQPRSDSGIEIEGIIVDEVTVPKMDGTRGSGLYKIPFKLSKSPSNVWKEIFVRKWDMPPQFTSMHRPGIARVYGDRIILDGTTIEEVEKYHRDTLKLVVEEANKLEKQLEKKEALKKEKERQRIEKHGEEVRDIASRIKFD